MTRVAINGAGRIGRAFLKLASENPTLEVVAINDLADIGNIAYLMKYDSAYGRSNLDIKADKERNMLIINGKEVQYVSEKDPANLPWGKLNVDIVLESTGLFTSNEKASAHIKAGAKRVVISAPSKDEAGMPEAVTVLMGINETDMSKCAVSSNASCTTNAASPLVSILNEKIGIEKAILNTTHAYTASQALVDAPNKKDWKKKRTAAMNMTPSSTKTAVATTKVITDLKGKFDGIAVRVPVITGSLVDITFIAKRPTSVEEVNNALIEASKNPRWQKVFSITNEPLVSSDIVGSEFASIADLGLTRVVDGNLVKVCAWYDNEMGYTHALVHHVIESGKHIK
jgi:glyceraldehyde 3-phosphate dehydrogenase